MIMIWKPFGSSRLRLGLKFCTLLWFNFEILKAGVVRRLIVYWNVTGGWMYEEYVYYCRCGFMDGRMEGIKGCRVYLEMYLYG